VLLLRDPLQHVVVGEDEVGLARADHPRRAERVVAAGRGGRDPHEVTEDLPVGRVRYFGSHYVHQVRNAGTEPAVSVHVYAPRLSVMNTYRVERGRLERIGTEQAGVDW
jgi:mannose-6-phosphate isomerase-like protein (cupin superfamily)